MKAISAMVLGVFVVASLMTGCSTTIVESRAPHGNMVAALEAGPTLGRRPRGPRSPLVVVVETEGLRAIDPVDARVRWSTRLDVVARPVASSRTVFVPLRGEQLVALSRERGEVLWRVPVRWEALTGVVASDEFVVLTMLDGGRARSRVVVLSALDGSMRWSRTTTGRFGVPALEGNTIVVPVGNQAVALSARHGRELARVDLPPLDPRRPEALYDQILVRDGAILAGRGARWVDVRAAVGGAVRAVHEVRTEGVDVLAEVEGMDPGYGEAERLRLWIEPSRSDAPPRDAILLCRRAVIAMRLDPAGYPRSARWVHLSGRGRELIAMDVGDERITLVAEDGSIHTLDRRTGEVLDTVRGIEKARGALLLDMHPSWGSPKKRRVGGDRSRRMLLELLRDPDPRILLAQRQAMLLLWRADDPQARAYIVDLAEGRLRPESTLASETLRQHALELMRSPMLADPTRWEALAWGARARASGAAEGPETTAGPLRLDL